jgi:hypothetical protein
VKIPRALPVLLILLAVLVVFHPVLFLGQAFLPADLLSHLSPWRGTTEAPNLYPWNVLRFDGITQFYPWRLQTARAFAEGQLPLTNPYTFAAEGGTPLWANGQSAPLYPLNILFWLLYKLFGNSGLIYAFGLSASLHLFLAGWGTYRLLRAENLTVVPALLAALAFIFCAPVTAWLSLPTFLCAVTWLPWLLRAIKRERVVEIGVFAGLTLLSGHLQIATYVLLAGIVRGLWQLRKPRLAPMLGGMMFALLIAVCLAAPQVFMSIELSRVSHRASQGGLAEHFAQWQTSAGTFLPVRSLITLLFPDFFGNPRVAGDFNLSGNAFAEWALYTGVCPLLLAGTALFLRPKAHGFYAILALLTLLVAMGPGSLPLYLFIPGFASTANPGRVLVLFSFAIACLAAFGLQGLMDNSDIPHKKRYQSIGLSVVTLVLLVAIGLNFSKAFLQDSFISLLNLSQFGMMVAGVWLTIALLLCFALPKTPKLAPALIILTLIDLLFWGWGHNPTSPMASVYRATPGMEWLQKNAKDALIAPINPRWSVAKEGPPAATLPPNGLTVFGLHDIAGYDSLFIKASKEHLDALMEGEQGKASPAENGNMVLVKSPETAISAGARYILMPPKAPTPAGLSEAYKGDDMAIYENPSGKNVPPTQTYDNPTLRVGFVLFLSAIGCLSGYIIYRFGPIRPQ